MMYIIHVLQLWNRLQTIYVKPVQAAAVDGLGSQPVEEDPRSRLSSISSSGSAALLVSQSIMFDFSIADSKIFISMTDFTDSVLLLVHRMVATAKKVSIIESVGLLGHVRSAYAN